MKMTQEKTEEQPDEDQALVPAPLPPPAPVPDNGVSLNLLASADSFGTAQRMAKAFAASTLVPKEYRDAAGVPNVIIAMEIAARIGSSPMAVMQNLHVIHGQPSFAAKFLIATVNSCGRFTPIRYRFEGERGKDNWGCRAVATDRDSNEELSGTLVDIKMAKAEGWYGKSGSKWKTLPEQMLRYRSASFWVRAYAPELSLGMHTRDELEDAHGSVTQGQRASAIAGKLRTAYADHDGVVDVEFPGHEVHEYETALPDGESEADK